MRNTGPTPGRVAYEGYSETTGWRSAVTGEPLPQWREQKPEIQEAWENAAAAVRAATPRPQAPSPLLGAFMSGLMVLTIAGTICFVVWRFTL